MCAYTANHAKQLIEVWVQNLCHAYFTWLVCMCVHTFQHYSLFWRTKNKQTKTNIKQCLFVNWNFDLKNSILGFHHFVSFLSVHNFLYVMHLVNCHFLLKVNYRLVKWSKLLTKCCQTELREPLMEIIKIK